MAFRFTPEQRARNERNREYVEGRRAELRAMTDDELTARVKNTVKNCEATGRFQPSQPVYDGQLVHHLVPELLSRLKPATERTERGWPGHHICRAQCVFHRNTLCRVGDLRVVVSTVGNLRSKKDEELATVGHDRHYETMVFYAKLDAQYWEANGEPIEFDAPWSLHVDDEGSQGIDTQADEMHEAVVLEICARMESNTL